MLAQVTPSSGPIHAQHNGEYSVIPQTKLTRKESQLLSLLQQNAGRCLSRQYLLSTIWGYQDGTRTRTLDVHIQRLRRKLGAEGASRIMTVLRTGYAWQG
ncbi:MAG: winged helix-turn-helix domain-containing protein [Bryobacterales bacterium]|nr:winged helix-turn-helix domain-containing protein [Bryobacterales bacterium]